MLFIDENNDVFSVVGQELISLIEKVGKKIKSKVLRKKMAQLRGGRSRKNISDKELRPRAKQLLGWQ